MKKFTLFLCTLLLAIGMQAAEVRVLSDVVVAKGYEPRLNADASELCFLNSEYVAYPEETASKNVSVSVVNEDLQLVLYRDGVRQVLTPDGADVNYIWCSLSPNEKMILFNTKYGTSVCDLEGKVICRLGDLLAPVWYGNDCVVGHTEQNDGHIFTAAGIAIRSLDGSLNQMLTATDEMGMYPTVSVATGKIAYATLDGDIHLMQLDKATQTVTASIPRLRKVEGTPVRRKAKSSTNKQFSDYRIYINPGHGGHEGDDRNMVIYPFKQGDPEGFWESNTNLTKGLMLNEMLQKLGFQTMMSRTTNNNDDDRALSAIVAEANAWNADFMLSIHSNAGTPSNYTLQLHSGWDPTDNVSYNDPNVTKENSDKSRAISTIIGNNIMSQKIPTWTRTAPWIAGDKTFARTIMGWSNGYGVLRYLKVPGVISEGRMHDYIPETYRMMNHDYLRDEAWQFLKSFSHYYMDYAQTVGAIGGQVRDNHNMMEFPAIYKLRGSRDELKPLTGMKVELLKDGKVLKEYVTDEMYNGVYYFWDLEPGTYTVRVDDETYYMQEETVEVRADEITYQDMLLSARRKTRPEVVDYSPKPASETDSVDVSVNIVLHFNWDMVEEATKEAFSITPAVEGTITFEDSYRTLRFTPAHRFEKEQTYTVRLAKTACHPDANYENTMAEDFVFSFRTKSRSDIRIIGTYPAEGMADVPLNPSFILLLDEKVYSPSVAKNVWVEDEKGQKVAVATRSYSYNKIAPAPYGSVKFELLNALQPKTQYRLVVDEGLADYIGIFTNKRYTINFTTADNTTPEGVLVNKMEDTQRAFEYDEEESMYVDYASTLRNTNTKYDGVASMELRYKFEDEEGKAMYKYVSESIIEGNNKSVLGMYVMGDFSGNMLYAKWDASGDIQYTPLTTLDYAGWKYVSADMSVLQQGVDYQFMGLQLASQSGMLSAEGIVYIDNMYAEHRTNTALDNVQIDEIRIYPNPVEGMLTVMGVEDADLQLFSADGKAVGQAKGNRMDVSSLPAGNYFLLIKQDGATIYRPVMKK